MDSVYSKIVVRSDSEKVNIYELLNCSTKNNLSYSVEQVLE